ncbi:MAG: hypothetical protein GX621_08035 [Pirellulaceae bacterium]|nr:hypothetical protein [Pirellulaceae bacterium]
MAIMAQNWGATNASWTRGDLNGDSRVDARDASILAANWRATTGEATSVLKSTPMPAPTSVPESSAMAIIAGAGLAGAIVSRGVAHGDRCKLAPTAEPFYD